MQYQKGYKYKLVRDVGILVAMKPNQLAQTQFLNLTAQGMLIIRAGYTWDGVSGPVRDTKRNLKASLVHDALYQLMRNGHLDHNRWREADECFATELRLGGVSRFFTKMYMLGLKIAKGKHAHPDSKRTVYTISSHQPPTITKQLARSLF